jgi:hypothetical protein
LITPGNANKKKKPPNASKREGVGVYAVRKCSQEMQSEMQPGNAVGNAAANATRYAVEKNNHLMQTRYLDAGRLICNPWPVLI